MTLQTDFADESKINPKLQFLWSVFHIVGTYTGIPTGTEAGTRYWRFFLAVEDAPQSKCIAIDVLGGPLDCPEFLPRVSCKQFRGPAAAEAEDDTYAAAEPLLVVRYMVAANRRAFEQAMRPTETDADGQRALKALREAPGGPIAPSPYVSMILAAGDAEIEQAQRTLAGNEAWVDDEFASAFYARSDFHKQQDGCFRLSVLYPPGEEDLKVHKNAVCSNCGKTSESGKFKECGKCGGAAYCGRECQVAHWKSTHKFVCKKTAEELREEGAGSGRSSVVFDLTYRPPGMPEGHILKSFSHLGVSGPARSASDGPPRDIHGGAEFVVKVQAREHILFGGARGGPDDNCMVYDETRSFDAMLPAATPGIDRLLQLMREGGLRRPGVGGKAYYMAKRAGVNLRIFTDKTVSPPAW